MGINTLSRALIVLGILCVAGTTANAGEKYITVSGVHTNDDEDRGGDEDRVGGQFTFGWALSDRVSLETAFGYLNLGGVNDLKVWDGSLNLLYSMRPYTNLSPYFIAGVGMIRTDSDAMDTENSPAANVGLGLMLRFGNSPVSLRLEHRARFEPAHTLAFQDQITSLGLQFAFGGIQTPAPAPKPAPPPPVERDGDADEDSVPDSRDECLNTAIGRSVDARGCPRDSDGDGVADDQDRCPNTVRQVPVDVRGCEFDSDNDRVVNRLDDCPNTSAGTRVDSKGCEIRGIINLPGVNFQTNSSILLAGAESVLDDAAATLRLNPDIIVQVAGHTDSAGSAEYNVWLSDRRANRVRQYLVDHGANSRNLTSRGYGEAEPVADNATAEGRARNRRVELRILSK